MCNIDLLTALLKLCRRNNYSCSSAPATGAQYSRTLQHLMPADMELRREAADAAIRESDGIVIHSAVNDTEASNEISRPAPLPNARCKPRGLDTAAD